MHSDLVSNVLVSLVLEILDRLPIIKSDGKAGYISGINFEIHGSFPVSRYENPPKIPHTYHCPGRQIGNGTKKEMIILIFFLYKAQKWAIEKSRENEAEKNLGKSIEIQIFPGKWICFQVQFSSSEKSCENEAGQNFDLLHFDKILIFP